MGRIPEFYVDPDLCTECGDCITALPTAFRRVEDEEVAEVYNTDLDESCYMQEVFGNSSIRHVQHWHTLGGVCVSRRHVDVDAPHLAHDLRLDRECLTDLERSRNDSVPGSVLRLANRPGAKENCRCCQMKSHTTNLSIAPAATVQELSEQ